MQIDPKERLGYAVVVVLIAAIAGVYGYRFSHKSEPAVLSTGRPVAPPATAAYSEIVVHVVGAVRKPGVYHLPGNSRAEDALKAAGGPVPKADLESVNLAARLTDGEQFRITVKGASEPLASSQTTHPAHGGKISSGTVALNSASAQELETVPGIGPATAEKIVSWRTSHGAFTNLEDLKQIGGIGDKKLQTMRPFLRL